MRGWGLVAAVVGSLALSPAVARAELHDAAGLHVLSQKQLSPRLIELSVRTSALPGPANIRILLPADYARHPRAR